MLSISGFEGAGPEIPGVRHSRYISGTAIRVIDCTENVAMRTLVVPPGIGGNALLLTLLQAGISRLSPVSIQAAAFHCDVFILGNPRGG